MPLSITAYNKLNADLKRSEAAKKAAATRVRREELHMGVMEQMWRTSGMDKTEVIKAMGGPFLELLGTKWEK